MTHKLLRYTFPVFFICISMLSFGQDSLFKKQYIPDGYILKTSSKFIKCSDGNFLVGFSAQKVEVSADIWDKPGLLKITPEGEILWAYQYNDDAGHTFFNDVAELSNGEIVMVCNHIGHSSSASILVLKLNKDGGLLWQNTITKLNIAGQNHLAIGPNDEIWIGNTVDMTGSSYKLLIAKYTPSGSYDWINYYGTNQEDILNDIIVNKAGNVVAAVERDAVSSQGRDMELLEILDNGDVAKRHIFIQENRYMREMELTQVSDGGYIVSYISAAIATGTAVTGLIKTDKDFKLDWATNGHETNINYTSYSATQLSNGQILMYGSYYVGIGPSPGVGMLVLPVSSQGFEIGSYVNEPSFNLNASATKVLEGNNGILYHTGIKTGQPPNNTPPMLYFGNFKNDYTFCKTPGKLSEKENIGVVTEQNAAPYVAQNIPTITRATTNFTGRKIPFTKVNTCSIFDFSCAESVQLPDSTICNTDEYILTANLKGYRYEWSTGDTTEDINIISSGKYSLKAYAPAIFGCDTLYDTADIILSPPIEFKMIGDVEAKAYDEVNFSVTGNPSYTYTWHMGDGNTQRGEYINYVYKETGIYNITLEVTDTNNCKLTDTLNISIKGFTYYLPNAITPNNDGKNDVFAPVGIGILKYQLTVFNRWGELLYKGNNIGWDGTYQGSQVMAGEYTYLITIQSDDLSKVNINGKIYVIR